MGHPCKKKTITSSSPDASDGRDHQQFMSLHDWKVRTAPPPPLPPQQKRLGLINDFSSIAGKLIQIQPKNFQWQHTTFFAAICIPGFISVLFSHIEFRIKATNQQ